MSNVILENSDWKITIASHGAELISAVRKADCREYMWGAEPDIWKRHSPVLFPLVGKYKNDTSFFEGKEYRMSQHGFARDMEFETAYSDEKSVKMTLSETEETLKKYPFKFKLSITYILESNRLCVIWEVENTNERQMYFSIGGHPAFIGKTDSLTGSSLVFETASSELEYKLIAPCGFLGDDTDILKLNDKKSVITEKLFDRDALIFEHTDCKKVSIEEDGERIVSLSFDAPLFAIWSATKKNNPFVCIEPWYGRVDREDFSGELPDREYSNSLMSGEIFKASYTISFGE